MDAESFDRVLKAEIPPCDVQRIPEDPSWNNLEASGGWTNITIAGAPSLILAYETTIDLSGYAMKDLTFYPHGGYIQEGGVHLFPDGVSLIDYTIVSSIPIDFENLSWQLSGQGSPGFTMLNSLTALGFGDDGQNPDTVMFAENRYLNTDSTITPNTNGFLRDISRLQSRSFEPTAADKLYVVRMVIPLNAGAAPGSIRLTIPASRVVLPGRMGKEPELEYMMRLKRSYELANQV